MKLSDVQNVDVGGVSTACIDRKQLVEIMVSSISEYRDGQRTNPVVIFDSNGHGISMANSDIEFNEALKQADIIHADGQSVVKMSTWVKGPNIPERSGTTDTIHDVATMQPNPMQHFLLGGKEEIVQSCASILSKKYDNFLIAGIHNGYFLNKNEEEVIELINKSGADVLWVGLGKPLEQKWVIENKDKLKVPVIITCGGCYNYVTGDYARAPMWMQNLGLEWLHRMLTEPRKLFWRYLTTNPHSIYCVLKHKYKSER
ncbi:WecB/TagA/CpsF family glycosyltransferase [Glaciecola sp. 1036]|uniref:WecB/TagA/CpsF family glycosyltransferase n=1 Tax=Alteromonadaceae TaxID=72275 RepID=UPI003CFD3ED3